MLTSCAMPPAKQPNSATLQNTVHKNAETRMSAMFDGINSERLTIGPFTTPNKAVHYVNPGRVYIQASITLSGEKYRTSNVANYIFEAELKSGETYSLKPTLKGECIEVYLESISGEKVGPFLQPWFDIQSSKSLLSAMSVEANKAYSKQCIK